MNLKNIDEQLTKSFNVLTAATVLKMVLFGVAVLLQFYSVASLIRKLNMSFSDFV